MAGLLFSVVVPTHRRPKALACLLAALAEQTMPANQFEVLVVDDGGNCPKEALHPLQTRGVATSLLHQQQGGPAKARNHGAREARGEYLAFVDDDCLPASNWLIALAVAAERHPEALLGGTVQNDLPEDIFAQATTELMAYLYQYYAAGLGRAPFYTANNMALPRRPFLALGGFDSRLRFGEDRHLCQRWRCSGRHLAAAPEAIVRHGHHLDLADFLRLHFYYGHGSRAFRRQVDGRLTVPLESPRLYLDIPLHMWGQARGGRRALLAALGLISQAATVAGYLWPRPRI